MPPLTRRTFLSTTATAAFAASRPRTLGINLYSVRDALAKDPNSTLADLAGIGYRTVELRPQQLATLAPMLQHHDLRPVHMMIETATITGKWEAWDAFGAKMAARMNMKAPAPPAKRPTLDETIELAAKHRLSAIGISYVLPEERPEPDGWERYAEQLSKAALKCKAAGIGLYHHNHSVELAGEEGKRPIDRLFRATSKDVGFEIDVFWAAVGGADPAKLIRRMKGRVVSLHLKDRAPGTPVSHDLDSLKPEWFREIGEGDLDIRSIVKAAGDHPHFLVEQDFSKRGSLESARVSYQALRKLAV